MSLSNSGMDENYGVSGGQAGDQTKQEWQIMTWYSYPWDCVLRHPNKEVRKLLAKISRVAANNNNIGYDQSNRLSYWNELQKVGYKPSKITTPCESDCSAGVAANIKAVGYRLGDAKLQAFPETAWTGVMRQYAIDAGFEVLTDGKYLTSPDYLKVGDILLNDLNHVAVNLDKGICNSKSVQAVPADYFEEMFSGTYSLKIAVELKASPGKDAVKIKKLKKHARVTNYGYYSKGGKTGKQVWYYVIDDTGAVGYVRKKYCKLLR